MINKNNRKAGKYSYRINAGIASCFLLLVSARCWHIWIDIFPYMRQGEMSVFKILIVTALSYIMLSGVIVALMVMVVGEMPRPYGEKGLLYILSWGFILGSIASFIWSLSWWGCITSFSVGLIWGLVFGIPKEIKLHKTV